MGPHPFPSAWRTNRRAFLQAATGSFLLPGVKASQAHAATPGPIASSSPPSQLPDSDLGNLHPFIQAQAVRGEFPLSYLQPRFRSAIRWRKTARAKLLELLHYAPAPCDPAPRVRERIDAGDHFCENVEFNTTPDLRVPATVLIPKGLSGPAPGIVALHDHGGFYLWGREKLLELPGEHPVLTDFKRQYYAGRSIATELVRRGYVVVVIDMFYWGERRLLLETDPEDWKSRPPTLTRERIQAFNSRAGQNEQLVGRSIYAAGFTWPGVMFWDDLRTVDYLLTRPEVDRRRIGCVGLSVGGLRSLHLAALDERIQAAVAVGWMTSFPWQIGRHIRHTIGHTKVVPGLYRHLDYPDVAALAMPRPLLVINGSRDALFHPEGVKAAFAKLNACYAKAGAADRCQTRLYDTPHEFNEAMQAEAWEWLGRWLRA